MEKTKKKEFSVLMTDEMEDILSKGLTSIAGLPAKPIPHPGETLKRGYVGVSRIGRDLMVTIAGENAKPFHLKLRQYVKVIEEINCFMPLQSHMSMGGSYQTLYQYPVQAVLNKATSSIVIMEGLIGREIGRDGENVAHTGFYYIHRALLQTAYIFAKTHLFYQEDVDDLLDTQDSWVRHKLA
jgi:hypothetical protein